MRQSSLPYYLRSIRTKKHTTEADTRRKVMLPKSSSHLHRTIAVLILSVSTAQSVHAQARATPGVPENLLQDSPIVPKSTTERGPMISPTGGLSTTQPVWTPG